MAPVKLTNEGISVAIAECIMGMQSPWFTLPARVARYTAYCDRFRACISKPICKMPIVKNMSSGIVSAVSTAA